MAADVCNHIIVLMVNTSDGFELETACITDNSKRGINMFWIVFDGGDASTGCGCLILMFFMVLIAKGCL